MRRFLTKFNQESHSRGHLMAKCSKSLALQSFTSRFWDRKSEGTNITLFLCSAKQHGQAHPQSALRRTKEREESERGEKERDGERIMNKFNYNINISRVGAISKHLLTPNFKNKQSILSFFISDRNYFPMLRKFIKKVVKRNLLHLYFRENKSKQYVSMEYAKTSMLLLTLNSLRQQPSGTVYQLIFVLFLSYKQT